MDHQYHQYKESTMRALVFSAMMLLSGCAGQERIVTKEVTVPVAVKAEAPDWLASGYKPEALPEFVAPNDPRASSALTPEGEKALRLIIIDLTGRDRAWREWAK
jgi:hypothetical protein